MTRRADAGGSTVDRARLQRLLGGPDTAWLLDRLVRRVERGQSLEGAVTLSRPSSQQRAAVDRLVGRPPTQGESLSVPVQSVERVIVDAGLAPDIYTAVVALRGPLRDLSAERAGEVRAWAPAEMVLDDLVGQAPELGPWREQVRARGLLRRLAGDADTARDLADGVRRCVLALPARDEPRSVFAARILGDGHALDDDRSLTTLVHGAARVLGDVNPGRGVEWRRSVWESVGILTGDLAEPVLTLGLRAAGDSLSARLLAASADAGEPVHLSLRQLVRHPPDLSALAGGEIHVCENPSVVAVAAERLGVRCRPLVCGGGHPSGAARMLLRTLTDAGAELRYHGDFDWAGLTIASGLVERYAATPWRFDAQSYLAAVAQARGGELAGRVVGAPWDAELADLMVEHGVRIEEEHVLDDLLADLEDLQPT